MPFENGCGHRAREAVAAARRCNGIESIEVSKKFPNERTVHPPTLQVVIRINLVPSFRPCTDGMPCSIEGAVMRRRVGGARCGACRRGSQPRPRELGHRPPPMRGPPLMAATRWMKGSANAAWITVSVNALRSNEEVRWLGQKSPQWSAGRRACRVTTARGTSQGARTVKAPYRRSAPSRR